VGGGACDRGGGSAAAATGATREEEPGMTAHQATKRLEAIASKLAQMQEEDRRPREAGNTLRSRYRALLDERDRLELHQHIGKPVRMKDRSGGPVCLACRPVYAVPQSRAL